MRKVWLDDLPKIQQGTDWKNSIGFTIKFEYDDINGEFKIIDYIKQDNCINIEYCNKIYKIRTLCITRGNLGRVLGKKSSDFKYRINDIIQTKTGVIKIIDAFRNSKNLKYYRYKCLIDDYEGESSESSIKSGCGCPVCNGVVVKAGVNDFATTNPKLAKLCLNKDDATKYTQYSEKKIPWKCPNCGETLFQMISIVNISGLSCHKCGDGISYPEKVMYSVLEQLNIKFIYQKSFEWSMNKKYDFYIPMINSVIEIHGMQHYSDSKFWGLESKDIQLNDLFKEDIAKNHDITYIPIDARYSTIEHIKNSILNSCLTNIFNFNNIDWSECDKIALKSLVKKVCELWESGINDTMEISNMLQLCRTTVIKYLKKGSLYQWCSYKSNHPYRKRRIICINTKCIYNSIILAEKSLHICGISNCCRKIKKSAGKLPDGTPLRWMYLDEYMQQNGYNDLTEIPNATVYN